MAEPYDEEDLDEIKVPIKNELEKRIAEVFDIFDVDLCQTVDVLEVSTILRGLGMCPTEAQVKEVIEQVEHPRIPGTVHLRHFMPVAVQLITKHMFFPPSPEEIMEAFRHLDTRGIGYLTKKEAIHFLTEDGEPFSQDEIDEMLELALDPDSQNLTYEYYINQLVHEPRGPRSAYFLADEIEAEKAAKAAAEAARRKFFFGGGN